MNFQEIEAFLDLVKNPDKYAAKLEELKALRGQLDERIAASGKMNEADKVLAKAQKVLEDSKLKAQEMLDAAELMAAKRKAQLDAEFEKVQARESQAALKVSNAVMAAQAAKDETVASMARWKQANELYDAAVAKHVQLDQEIQEVAATKKKLREAMA